MAHLFTPVKQEEVPIEEEQETGNPNPFGMIGGMLGLGKKQEPVKVLPQKKEAAHSPEEHLDSQSADEKFFNEKFPEEKEFNLEEALESLKGSANYEKLKSRMKSLTPAQQKAAVEYAIKCQKLLQKKKKDKVAAEEDTVVGSDLARSSVTVVRQSDVEDSQLLDAVRNGRNEEVVALLGRFKRTANTAVIAKGDKESHPLLHWAALEDQTETLELLMSMGGDPNAVNPRGESPIHWACLRGHIGSVYLLLRKGAKIDATDERGYSPMHHAAQFGKVVVMAMLHRRGAPVDVRDNHGRTPLHWAAYKNEAFTVQWLINHGADISAEDWENCMPMHWAALQGLSEVATTLMRNGALKYLESRDKTGFTAGELALNKSKRFHEKSSEAIRYKRVGKYLEETRLKGRDRAIENSTANHWSWYLWPFLSPIAWYHFYFFFLPVTIYTHPIANFLLTVGALMVWISWLILQVKDPGFIVLETKATKFHKKTIFNYIMCCYGVSGITPNANESKHSSNGTEETHITIDPSTDSRFTIPNPHVKHSQLYRDLYDEVLDRGLQVPVCTYCEIVKPLRSKHDRFTNRCCEKFDHFCPWVGVAIAGNNYREFFTMLLGASFCMNAWVYLVIVYTYNWNLEMSFWQNFYDIGRWSAFYWFFFPIALYATVLFLQHLMFVFNNVTTNEMINRFKYEYLANGNPFSRGRLSNVAELLGLIDPIEIDIRQYYKDLFDGTRSKNDNEGAEVGHFDEKFSVYKN